MGCGGMLCRAASTQWTVRNVSSNGVAKAAAAAADGVPVEPDLFFITITWAVDTGYRMGYRPLPFTAHRGQRVK